METSLLPIFKQREWEMVLNCRIIRSKSSLFACMDGGLCISQWLKTRVISKENSEFLIFLSPCPHLQGLGLQDYCDHTQSMQSLVFMICAGYSSVYLIQAGVIGKGKFN